MAKIKIEGLSELKKELKNLSDREAKNITNSALRAGASTINKSVKSNVPTDSGNLKKFIKVKKRRSRNKNEIRFSISPQIKKIDFKTIQGGVSSGYRAKLDALRRQKDAGAWYFYFLEFGTKHQKAQPMFRPAFDSTNKSVTDDITRKMAQRIEKISNSKAR